MDLKSFQLTIRQKSLIISYFHTKYTIMFQESYKL